MTAAVRPDRILLVTGMSGAGKSTALKTFEDMGWEAVDNLPFALLARLLETQPPAGAQGSRPLAIGIDSRTRGFDAGTIHERINAMHKLNRENIAILFLDCSCDELLICYSESCCLHR